MKKNVLLIVVMLSMFVCIPSALAANITGCESILPNIQIDVKIANAVHTIITVIKVVVPVLLVVFGMIDLFKGITAQKEDEIKKGQQIFIKRIISAVLVFFVIAIVQLLISFAAGDEPGLMNCASCFLNGASANGSC